MAKKKIMVVPNYCGFTEDEMFALYKVKSSPWFWRKKAEELKYAADILWPLALDRLEKISASLKSKKELDLNKLPPEIFSTAEGLLGYSLECLLKASIIRDNPNFMDKGQQDECLKTHNLLKLAGLAKIQLTQDEERTCETLTDAMYLDFRYPVDRQVKLDKGSITMGRSIIDVGNELYEKLHVTVDQIHTAKGDVIKFESTSAKYVAPKKAKKVVAAKRAVRKNKQ